MSIYLGIDPGAKGSLCILDTQLKVTTFLPVPSGIETPQRLRKDLLDLDKITPIDMAAIEDVHSIFGMSAGSNFQFGFNVGILHGIMRSTHIGLDVVQPKVWQKAVGVVIPPKSKPTVVKQAIAAVALRLYPHAQLFGPKGGLLDGRADALMIAHYLSTKYGNK